MGEFCYFRGCVQEHSMVRMCIEASMVAFRLAEEAQREVHKSWFAVWYSYHYYGCHCQNLGVVSCY